MGKRQAKSKDVQKYIEHTEEGKLSSSSEKP